MNSHNYDVSASFSNTINEEYASLIWSSIAKQLLSKFEFSLRDILVNIKNISVFQAITAIAELQQLGFIEVISDKTSFKCGKFARIYYRICQSRLNSLV